MSAEATAWVWRRSPYKGVAFAVHLAIADSVNDQNEYELWMRQAVLAVKARTRRATVNTVLAQMIQDGFLDLLNEGTGGANRYRFRMPVSQPVVFESRPVKHRTATRKAPGPAPELPLDGARPADTTCTPSAQGVRGERAPGVRPARTEQKGTKATTQGENPGAGSIARDLVAAVWERSNPKPATPYIGAVKIAERLLVAGHTPAAIEDAMVEAPTISTGAVEMALSRRRPARGAAAPVKASRDAPEGRVRP